MRCYRDTTFCDGANRTCQNFGQCFRALTDEVRERAEKVKLPIMSFRSAHLLDCYEPKKDETK